MIPSCFPLVGVASLISIALLAPANGAAQQPSCAALEGETIRWIVPYSPGGGFDAYSRLIEPVLEDHLRAEIAVINMPGAGGMVGAKSIRAAAPDGKTLGLVNASGLLFAQLLGEDDVPDLTTELATLARVERPQSLWVTRADGDVRFSDTGEVAGGGTPLLFGVTGVGSDDWLTISIGNALLGLEADVVAGYDGSLETQLGLIRGEFDLLELPWSSALTPIENGEIRPVVQMTNAPIADHPALAGVPLLGGENGLAVARAEAMGTDIETAQEITSQMIELTQAGRVVVAPSGLPLDITACLEDRLYLALTDPALTNAAAAARRPLDVASGRETAASIAVATEAFPTLRAIVEDNR
jgi:tripartite-type tricarboxylate transporter receptor subunit TctC